jgi:hypothetical protein
VTYATVEVAVQTLIRAMTEFDDADVSRGDYKILDSGADDLAILTPGSFTKDETGQAGARKSLRNWSVIVDLFRKYLDDETTWINFVATRDALVDHLELYPSLNNTAGVTLVGVEAGSDPSEIYDDDDDGPFFIFQRIRVAVNERTDLSGGEYS